MIQLAFNLAISLLAAKSADTFRCPIAKREYFTESSGKILGAGGFLTVSPKPRRTVSSIYISGFSPSKTGIPFGTFGSPFGGSQA